MTEPRKDLTAELRARDKSRANDAKADLRFTKYFEYERDAKAQAKDLAERHGIKATVKPRGNQFEVVVSDGAQDEKPTREMTTKEIQAEIKAGGGREFQFPGGAVRWKALQDALHEKQVSGEDEITKQAKDAATWRSPKVASDATQKWRVLVRVNDGDERATEVVMVDASTEGEATQKVLKKFSREEDPEVMSIQKQ